METEKEAKQIRKIRSMRDLMDDFGKSRSSIYRLIQTGKIPKPFKVGGTNGWFDDEIEMAKLSLASPDRAEAT